jgi:hypothetical protein
VARPCTMRVHNGTQARIFDRLSAARGAAILRVFKHGLGLLRQRGPRWNSRTTTPSSTLPAPPTGSARLRGKTWCSTSRVVLLRTFTESSSRHTTSWCRSRTAGAASDSTCVPMERWHA